MAAGVNFPKGEGKKEKEKIFEQQPRRFRGGAEQEVKRTSQVGNSASSTDSSFRRTPPRRCFSPRSIPTSPLPELSPLAQKDAACSRARRRGNGQAAPELEQIKTCPENEYVNCQAHLSRDIDSSEFTQR